jgi:hypothetical protein
MTHHQPISAFDKHCPALLRLLQQNKVTAWFWGHEHRFALYAHRSDLPYGRLIGHGGVPVHDVGRAAACRRRTLAADDRRRRCSRDRRG